MNYFIFYLFFIIHFILIWLYSNSNVYKHIRLIYGNTFLQ